MEDIENPHYLEGTLSAKVRADRNSIRFSQFLNDPEVNLTKQLRQTNPIKTNKNRKETLNAEDRLANEEVLRSMNHKMNYLRNPRNSTIKLSKTITNPTSASHSNDNFAPIASDVISLFESDPKLVIFDDYVIGYEYKQVVHFRNISTISRSVRVIPPKSAYFTMSELKYPLNCKSGLIAPGMSVSATITFKPDALSDFHDAIIISSESGKLTVPLLGQREAARLNLPPVIEVGTCLVGDASRYNITCTNTGGTSKINIFAADDYDTEVSLPASERNTGCVRSYPFTVYPIEFTLAKHQSIDVIIEFVPLDIGSFEKTFIVHYDNHTTTSFIVRGESKKVDISILDINDSPMPSSSLSPNSNVKGDLFFDDVVIGSESSQTFTIANDTGIALEYEWVLLSTSKNFSSDDIFVMAQNKVHGQSMLRQQHQHGSRSMLLSSPSPDILSPSAFLDSPKRQKHYDMMIMSSDYPLSSNSIHEYGFEIHPYRGVLCGEGLETITVTFHPASSELVDVQAVLVVKGIPYAAMSNAMQYDRLQALKIHGHGSYPRLCSWMEDIGISNEVDTHIDDNNGAHLSQMKITNLKLVDDIVKGYIHVHASHEHDEMMSDMRYELEAYRKRMLQLLDHVNRWQHCAIEADDEDGVVDVGIDSYMSPCGSMIDDEDHHSHIESSQPATSRIDECAEVSRSSSIMSLGNDDHASKPSIEIIQSLINAYYYESSDMIHDDTVKATLICPLKIKDVHDEHVPHKVSKANHLTASIKPYDMSTLPSYIYLDAKNICILLGSLLSSSLNELVKHEAVDYLRHHCLTNVAFSSTRLAGRGSSNHISLKPPHIDLPGDNSIGKSWKTSVTLVNRSSAVAEVKIQTNALSIYRLDTATISVDKPTSSIIIAECDDENIILMPDIDTIINLTIIGYDVGKYHITIPIISSNEYTIVDSISLTANIVSSKLRFDVAEVDVGLIAVGSTQSVGLCFTNESNTSIRYVFSSNIDVEYETTAMLLSSRPSKTSRYNPVQSLALRSVPSRGYMSSRSHGTHRSDDTSPTGSIMSSDRSYQIENPTASISFEPTSNIIDAFQSSSVNIVCKGGRVPQRIRGTISCQIYDMSGQIELHRHMINLRGEVQAPKAIIYPLINDLHDIYVGIPVSFQVTLQNLSNLPTKFKLDYPNGIPTSYQLSFDIEKGILSPKQTIILRGEVVALSPGIIDDIYSIKIFGLPKPLGFTLSARSRGVAYELAQVYPGDSIPKPLCHPSAVQYKPVDVSDHDDDHDIHVPEPNSSQVLSFTDEVHLYDRSSITIALRNYSAIPIPYNLSFEHYSALGNDHDQLVEGFNDILYRHNKKSTNTSYILPPDHMVIKPSFQSKVGQHLMLQKTQRVEDKNYLKSGLGAAYIITPSSHGTIEPWGCSILTINACNEMPGCYNDTVHFKYFDHDKEKTYSCPVKLTVEGCPLTIDRNTIGMSYVRDSKLLQMVGKPLLRMGQGLVNTSPMQRIFVVKNNGSNSGSISWKLSNYHHKTRSVSFGGDDNASYISIEPSTAVIPKYASMTFTVMMLDPSIASHVRVIAEAEVEFIRDDIINDVKHPESKHSLNMMIEGEYIYPTITIGKKAYVAKGELALAADSDAIELRAQAPHLFSESHQDCSKLVSISNPLEVEVSIAVSTTGPYALCKATTRASDDIVLSATSKRKTVSLTSTGVMNLILAPHVSESIKVKFYPEQRLQQTLHATSSSISSTVDITTAWKEEGSLMLQYSSGQQLQLPLRTTVSTPFLAGSTSSIQFGVCHVKKSCHGLMLLSNATDVTASWTVTAVPHAGASKRSTEIAIKGYDSIGIEVDDPSVFIVTPTAGMLEGPCVSVAAAIAANPHDLMRSENSIVQSRITETSWMKESLSLGDTLRKRHDDQHQFAADVLYPIPIRVEFHPTKNVKYSSRFRFTCEYGNIFDMIVQGVGTYEEHEHMPLCPIPR